MAKLLPKFYSLLKLLATVALFVGFSVDVNGQRTYSNEQSNSESGSTLLANWSVVNPDIAKNNNQSINYAELRTNVLVNLGTATAWLQTKFTGSVIPGGTTTYIKIGGTNLTSLLGLIGGGNIVVNAYTGATSSSNGTLIAQTNVSYEVLNTPAGLTYLAVTSTIPYNSVRVNLVAPALLGTSNLYIYHAFFETPGTGCSEAIATATRITGVLSLGATINNPNNAIDNNLNTNSAFAAGVGVGATLHQRVYFSSLSQTGDVATITLSVPPALLAAGVLGTFTITPYRGSTPLTSISYSSLLMGTDLLSLLNTGAKTTISFVPSGTFDRIEISLGSVVAVGTSLNIFEISRTPAKPTFPTATTPPAVKTVTICSGRTTTITPTAASTGNEIRWYDAQVGGTLKHTGNSYTTDALTENTNFYIATAKVGCSAESERVPVYVVVNSVSPGSLGSNQSICSGLLPTAFTNTAATGSGAITYQWQKSTDNATFANISGATTANYSESTALTKTTYYQRIATSTLNTVDCSAISNKITVTVNPLPTATVTGTIIVCQSATIPPSLTFTAANGTGPYTFTYKINNGTNQTISTTSGNSVSLTVSNAVPGTYTYTLVSVSNTQCSQPQTGTAVVTITPKPASPNLSIQVNN